MVSTENEISLLRPYAFSCDQLTKLLDKYFNHAYQAKGVSQLPILAFYTCSSRRSCSSRRPRLEALFYRLWRFLKQQPPNTTFVIFAPFKTTTLEKEIMLSGIRPTGLLHLGNYFGAIRNYVRMQEDFNCFVFVADWHSLTTHLDTSALKSSVARVIAENVACGLDHNKVAFFVQSDLPEIAELYLYLNMLAYKGELEKTVSFKDKVRLQPENVNAGLLTYPVLQAADILIHRATKVPVGKDQEQHLEMARNFAQRFNHRYGKGEILLPEPKAFNYGIELIKILSLDGNGKMSKSENQMNTLYFADEDDMLRKKIMKAKTDSGPAESNSTKPDYIENIFTLLKLVSTPDVLEKFEADFNNSSAGNVIIRYGELKKQLAEDMVKFIAPIREKAFAIQHNEKLLKNIMEEGKEKARKSAKQTLQIVREAVGVNYY